MRNIPDEKQGWLAPDGTFYACGWCKHYEFAKEYFQNLFKKDFFEKTRKFDFCFDDALINRGWVKIIDYPSCYKNGFTVQNYIGNWFSDKKKITKEQEKYLYKHHQLLLLEYYRWKNGVDLY